ncbi:hypothetical protein NG796_04635 [Laspinema sp. A4]|uniref:hypothetical protein n=1 Tax=Laspinema sp. D2d TaxID=2953686 RepID=UPI0021BA7741|nr:hypothetical protein [Laspinema sp. D2d]MCT7982573.1 hypothetical protein [Laspinema sp. D2d]
MHCSGLSQNYSLFCVSQEPLHGESNSAVAKSSQTYSLRGKTRAIAYFLASPPSLLM